MSETCLSEMEEMSIADRVTENILKRLGVTKESDESIIMYTREEVANILHTTVQTAALLQEMGAIKAIHIGKQYLTPRDELLRFSIDYRGLDVSNRSRIERAVKQVNER